MRLYRAICSWIEADAGQKAATAPEVEHQPQGNNFATTERNYDSAPHEMNSESRHWWPAEGPYGRAISLKWNPKETA